MATADRILDLIDTGLAEAGTPTAPAYGRKGECDRCDAPADEEVCEPCRAFLLGDSPVDPASMCSRWTAFVVNAENIARDLGATGEQAAAAMRRLADDLNAAHGDLPCQCPACWCPICGATLGGPSRPEVAQQHECDLTGRAQPMGFVGASPITAERARITALNEPLVPRPAEYTGTIVLTAGDGITYEALRELFGIPDRPQG